MSTTVHLPPKLLESVDRRAGELGLSRNRYIRRALERALADETRWGARFRQELAAAQEDGDGRQELEELRRAVAIQRTRKPPPPL